MSSVAPAPLRDPEPHDAELTKSATVASGDAASVGSSGSTAFEPRTNAVQELLAKVELDAQSEITDISAGDQELGRTLDDLDFDPKRVLFVAPPTERRYRAWFRRRVYRVRMLLLRIVVAYLILNTLLGIILYPLWYVGFLVGVDLVMGFLAVRLHRLGPRNSTTASFEAMADLTALSNLLIRIQNTVVAPSSTLFLILVAAVFGASMEHKATLRICVFIGSSYAIAQSLYSDDHEANFVAFVPLAVVLTFCAIEARRRDILSHREFVVRRQLRLREAELRLETGRARALLFNIFPEAVADVLARSDGAPFDFSGRIPQCTVLVCDLVGFTAMSAQLPATTVVEILNTIFSRFDALTDEYQCVRIKSIGDCAVVATCPIPRADGPACVCAAGLEFVRACQQVAAEFGHPISLRVGIHQGPVECGMVGVERQLWDIAGAGVRMAFELEAASKPDQVLISQEVAGAVMGNAALVVRPSGSNDSRGSPTYYVEASRRGRYRTKALTAGESLAYLESAGYGPQDLPVRLLRADGERRRSVASSVSVPMGGGVDLDAQIEAQDERLVAANALKYKLHASLRRIRFVDPDVEDAYWQFQSTNRQSMRLIMTTILLYMLFNVSTDAFIVLGRYDASPALVLGTRFGLIVPLLLYAVYVLHRRTPQVADVARVRRSFYAAFLIAMTRLPLLSATGGIDYDNGDLSLVSSEFHVLIVCSIGVAWLPGSGVFSVLVMTGALLWCTAQMIGGASFAELLLFGVLFPALVLLTSMQRDRADRSFFAAKHVADAHSASLEERLGATRDLALTVLPPTVYARLLDDPNSYAQLCPRAVVGFCAVSGFDELADELGPRATIQFLHDLYAEFERLVKGTQSLEKIKGNLNATFLFAGAILPSTSEAEQAATAREAVELALALRDVTPTVRAGVQCVCAVHTGPLVAGVLGASRFALDVFGDTVNTCARLQQTGPPGSVPVSTEIVDAVGGQDLVSGTKTTRVLKGRGQTTVWDMEALNQATHPFGPP